MHFVFTHKNYKNIHSLSRYNNLTMTSSSIVFSTKPLEKNWKMLRLESVKKNLLFVLFKHKRPQSLPK